MAGPLVGGFTDAILAKGMSIVFEARNASTGAAVSGVKVSNVGILAEGQDVGSGEFVTGAFQLVPGPGA